MWPHYHYLPHTLHCISNRCPTRKRKMTVFHAIFYKIRTFHNCGMNWDITLKKYYFMKKVHFSCHNCTILSQNCTIFLCVPKYLTIAQYLPNLWLTFPAGQTIKYFTFLFLKEPLEFLLPWIKILFDILQSAGI